MPRWLPRILSRIRALAAAGRVTFTRKAEDELSVLGGGLEVQDALQILAGLVSNDCHARHRSATTGEWLYVFKPVAGGSLLYVKVVLRTDCIVVSFHEDGGANDDEA